MTIPAGILAGILLATNLLAFLAQGWDKFKARRGTRRRTPEKTLLLLGLPLAALGMLLGMRTFRHKTRKRKFQLQAAAVVFANLLEAGGLCLLAMEGLFDVELALY